MTEFESFPEWSRALEAQVQRLKADGASPEEVARETLLDRGEFYRARSDAFRRATQGRGKPLSKMRHGDGKRTGEK